MQQAQDTNSQLPTGDEMGKKNDAFLMAIQAKAAQETHNQVCTERYGNIDTRMTTMQNSISENATQLHARLNTISNRIHGYLIGSLAGTILLAGTVIWYTITKGHG